MRGPRLPHPLQDGGLGLFDCKLSTTTMHVCPIYVDDSSMVHRVRGWCVNHSFGTLPPSPLSGPFRRQRDTGVIHYAWQVEVWEGKWSIKGRIYRPEWAEVRRNRVKNLYCPEVSK